jgi:hypothetical protein
MKTLKFFAPILLVTAGISTYFATVEKATPPSLLERSKAKLYQII